MPVSESMVQEIVQQVMAKMQIADAPAEKQHGVFKDMNDAIEAAKKSQEIVHKMSMDQREKIITCIRKKIKENAEETGNMANYALAQILKISCWHKALETFGPIPYTHAGEGLLVVPYDTEQEVYTAMFNDF